ncbi:Cap-specific mRNA (nucleoside-2'-O-)-methyltransferase 2 [Armadillidium vulgare]|nr:Cap-specific mRNA (nucleoside-2'-O-)-methyltransferase 2 [Armadillidium vulgare]
MKLRPHCSKLFHLKTAEMESSLWKIPPPDQLYVHEKWKIEELIAMKNELNKTKGQLENFDIDSWHKHTQLCNPAHKISNFFRYKAKPELLTQAFLKFFEVLHAFPLVPEFDNFANSSFKTLHLCEAPGAFIVALNHYLSLHRPNIKWQWLGNTLNPYFEGTPSTECIADDRFILHTLDNWCFGNDETGNLMTLDYLDELIRRVGRNNVDLVTADGSIDCQEDPAEQENTTNSLHFCEVYSALCALKKGGCLVLKKFTFFEVDAICLVYLICCCFKKVSIYKPITSKLGNSEVYLVALSFEPSVIELYMNTLRMHYGQKLGNVALFSLEQIPSDFITLIKECSTFFKERQVKAIERNIYLYHNPSEKNNQYVDLLKSMVLETFEENNSCRPIAAGQRIVSQNMKWDYNIIPDRHNTKWGGQIKKRQRDERLKFLEAQLESALESFRLLGDRNPQVNRYNYVKTSYKTSNSYLSSLKLRNGKPFHFVFYSRFCLINIYQLYIHYLEEYFNTNELQKVTECHSELSIHNPELHNHHVTSINNSTSSENLSSHLVVDEGFYIAPHNCHKALDQLLSLMGKGELEEGKNVIILNCPLYTRIQTGLFHVISSAFETIEFNQPSHVPVGLPYLILKNFTSVQKGRSIFERLKDENWFDVKNFSEILPLGSLINSDLYSELCKYNSLFSLSQIGFLQILLKDKKFI